MKKFTEVLAAERMLRMVDGSVVEAGRRLSGFFRHDQCGRPWFGRLMLGIGGAPPPPAGHAAFGTLHFE